MKSKYETLKDIINYTTHETKPNELISKLLKMGFDPCALVNEFDFDANNIIKTNEYQSLIVNNPEMDLSNKILLDNDNNGINIDEEDWSGLSKYNDLDGSVISRLRITEDEFKSLKPTNDYKSFKEEYDREVEYAINVQKGTE